MISSELHEAIRAVARVPQLLVGCDYDGTLAPLQDDPTQALPLPEAVAAIRAVAALAATTVVVVSGRSLRDLATLSRLPSEIHLVGSHGSEFDADFLHDLEPELAARLRRLNDVVAECASDTPGVVIEHKPASVAVHVRRCSIEDSTRVSTRLLQRVGGDPDVHVTFGKAVMEFAVIAMDKGHAFAQMRSGHGATAAIFVGDDLTDEAVFTTFSGPDVSIKVGAGPTAATHRVDDPLDVARMFAVLAQERRLWLAGPDAVPIHEHTLLADGMSLALLTPRGRITWMCHPTVDSAAVFADLLGGESAGHFTITPVSPGMPLSHRYESETMVATTRWAGMDVTDYLDCSGRNDSPGPVGTVLVRAIKSRVPIRVVFSPRPEFGQVPIRIEVEPDGLRVTGAAEPLVLRAPGFTWDIHQEGAQQTAVGTLLVDVQRTQPVYSVLELRLGADLLSPHPLEETARRRRTLDYWRDWVQRLHVPNVHRDAVIRSALTLKALCYERTGAILAAATTSLPEGVGGVRNWDYRYCWIRDAAISAKALVNIGSTEEAQAFLLWLHVVIAEATAPERLHPLYTVLGTTLGTEAVVDSLPGYGGSRPVRVGNAAQGQVQLDVFGPVVDLIASLVALRGRATENDLWLTRACVNAVQARWQEADHGIWEIRDQPLHHVHSKVMCWLAVTRGIEVLAAANEHSPQWEHLQQEIAAEVLDQGWHEALQAYVCAYDRRELDAAALHIGLTDLLPADDPRLVSTIEAVEAGLRAGPTVLRYTYDDGLPGREGGMIICATWLVECYARAGMLDSAHELLRQVLECSGSTGLLSEQWDQERGCGLGNHPQAYSHAGVIQAALALERHDHRSR